MLILIVIQIDDAKEEYKHIFW